MRASTTSPRPSWANVGSSARNDVTWVSAKTKTRSKNSSSGDTVASRGSARTSRCVATTSAAVLDELPRPDAQARAVGEQCLERAEHVGVEAPGHLGTDGGQRLVGGHGRTIGALRGQRLVDVRD